MIRFGSLREKVKKGELSAQDVLVWLKTRKNVSPKLITWLENFDLAEHQKRSENDRQKRENLSKK